VLAGILTVLAYDPDNSQLDYYRSILRAIHPGIRERMTEAAILKTRNGDFDLAEEIFLALHGLDPEDRLTTLNLALLADERADSFRKSGLDDEADASDARAFEWYKAAMTAEPPLPAAFFNAGFFYLKQKNYKKAREAFETYASVETAGTEDAKAKIEKAREIAEGIASRDLDDDLFKAAYDFIRIGEEEKALESIRLFMDHNPRVWNAWFLLGWALRRLERWEDARAAFLQALELIRDKDEESETGFTDICNELAIALMELGELGEARKYLIMALERESENTKIISNLGIVSLKAGNASEAAGFFRTVLEIDPRDALAKDLLARAEGN
jgi:tetratricopeptide (TPR) repeat protein